jgi:hypothetical protein
MGYIHTWRYQPHSPAYAAAWPGIVEDSNRIIAALSGRIAISGPHASGVPLLSARDGIAYNGGPGQEAQAFLLAVPGTTQRQWWYCKTDGLPYDLAVTATLLCCHLRLPAEFLIASDGDWNTDWKPPRRLIKRLFDAENPGPAFSDDAYPTDADLQALNTDSYDR